VDSRSCQEDTSTAVVSVSIVQDWLAAVIKGRMRSLSSKLEERLFSGHGPLSTFSGMIDLGYAFELFDTKIYNDLRALKDIRNAFAHSTDALHFDSPELTKHFQKLTGWDKNSSPGTLFSDRIHAVVDALKPQTEINLMVQAIKDYRAKQETSDEKSP
jgi:DNA-binding MltR family transcriptional regulator